MSFTQRVCQFANTLTLLKQQLYVQIIHAGNKQLSPTQRGRFLTDVIVDR